MRSDIRLAEVTEENWLEAASLSVREDQKEFVAPATGILARGYGFVDSGYIDEDVPDLVNMICRL